MTLHVIAVELHVGIRESDGGAIYNVTVTVIGSKMTLIS
jgi:hypothetical protein